MRVESQNVQFGKLEVWLKAIRFSDLIYRITGESPSEERFGLTNQLRRAALSIASNVAEGSSRGSRKDFARFVEIGYGSLMEVVSQLHIAREQRMVKPESFKTAYEDAQELARMLSGLRTSLKN